MTQEYVIKNAETATEIQAVRRLFREYESYLNVDLCFQDFENELTNLPGVYVPPDGALLIAVQKAHVVGCVAVRRMDDSTCEMKRLYVIPETRGSGLGRQLAEVIIQRARDLGYRRMVLDTLDRLKEAMGLYESLGFRRTAPYYDNPLPGVVYWELTLM